MARIPAPSADTVPAESRPILDSVGKRLGFVPNMHRVMALSPAALVGWSGLLTSLSKTLDVKTRDAIGLAVSEVNGCRYCLSAHTYVSATFSKVSPEEIAANRAGRSSDPKRDAAVRFARRLVELRGKVTEADVEGLRAAGFGDAQMVEIIALSAQFLLTNFINNAIDTEIDFPVVDLAEAA